MSISENIRTYRKDNGFSQEDLAQKIGVSRQAVTKWETGAGMPDISNVVELSKLFGVTVDELLDAGTVATNSGSYLFESVTEFDIEKMKNFDINLGRVRKVGIVGHPGEKVRVVLGSDRISTLQQDFKVRLDDGKNIDIDVKSTGNVSETEAKESLDVMLELPNVYLDGVELNAIAEEVRVADIENGKVELDVKAPRFVLNRVKALVEIDCNIDAEIECQTLEGSLEVNQVKATSRVIVPANAQFQARCKGLKTALAFRDNGNACEPFGDDSAELHIELNGLGSELVICR